MSKLVKSSNDRMIAGVCGGLAKHFGIDVTLVRVGFVVLTAFSPGLIIYIILALIMPNH